jgi:hypothetical protein
MYFCIILERSLRSWREQQLRGSASTGEAFPAAAASARGGVEFDLSKGPLFCEEELFVSMGHRLRSLSYII